MSDHIGATGGIPDYVFESVPGGGVAKQVYPSPERQLIAELERLNTQMQEQLAELRALRAEIAPPFELDPRD